MSPSRVLRVRLAVLACLLLLPAAALAQTGAIAGGVTDETGGVLPGVTVEAASPALIEGVRSTVTDGAGLYGIEALRPGTYTVRFTLPGFSTFVREGIELTSDFTANVDAQMGVGSIEETITVSGASPVIDVQNVVSQENLSREQLDTLPTSKTYFGLAALTPGMSASIAGGGHDVGGSTGDIWGYVTIHGSSDQDGMVMWDGMSINNNIEAGGGSSKEFFLNQAAIQEMVISTSDMNAEYPYGGVATNAIPKEGGNQFSYYVNVSGTNGDLQAANVDSELEARGASPLAKNRKIWDYGVGIGGPLVRDRVWFYTAHRWWGAQNFNPKGNVNMTPHAPTYVPDPDQPSWTDFYNQDNSIRFTFQASERHKFTLSQAFQSNCACHYWTQWGYTDMDAAVDYTYWPINLSQASWTFPASNRLLFEAGVSILKNNSAPRRQDQVVPSDIAHVNWSQLFNWQAFGFCVNGPCLYGTGHDFPTNVFRASMSYVTGSHNFKVGVDGRVADENHALSELNGDPLRFEFISLPAGVFGPDPIPQFPFQVTQFALPRTSNQTSFDFGLYAQDQWTIDRLTLNLGVRYDHVTAWVPEQTALDTPYVLPPSVLQRIDGVPSYHDITPRLGASYDLFGDGRTALKATWGRYIMAIGTRVAQAINPMEAIQGQTSRTWFDANGDLTPNCDFGNFGGNGECGPIQNPEFGTPAVVRSYDPDLLSGWGKRAYNWQNSVSLQHELFEGWSVEVGWYRTAYGNFLAVDNLNIGPDDFSGPFSITAPVDDRLGSYSGATLDGLYTIKPEGQAKGAQEVIKLASEFGDMTQVFNGIDVNINGRLDNGVTLGGGVSMGSTTYDECFVVDNPIQNRSGYCDVSQPWGAGTQLKLNGAVPLPWDTQFSFVFQNLAGLPWESRYEAGANPIERAAIEAQIGHPMVTSSEQIQLFPAGQGINTLTDLGGGTRGAYFFVNNSQFYERRLTQLDIRFTKIVNVGRARVRAWIDLFNIFNANHVSSISPSYNPGVYPVVAGVMGGRLLKFGGQFDF